MCCNKGKACLFLIFNSLIVCLETATPSPSLKLTILPSKHPTSRPSGYLLKHFIFEIKIVMNYFKWMLDHHICAPDNWNTHTAFFGHLFVIVGFTHKTILVWMNGQSQRINCFCGNKFSPQIYILCILFNAELSIQCRADDRFLSPSVFFFVWRQHFRFRMPQTCYWLALD